MAELVYLSNVRLSFPHIVEPHAPANDTKAEKKYSADFLMEQTHPAFATFMHEVQKDAVGKWGENAANVMQLIQQDRRLRCFGAGSEKVNKKTFQPYDGYGGMVYISASNKVAPQMIQPDGSAVDPVNTMAYQALARKLYGGCYVNAAVRSWPQDNAHGRGVRCDLVAIQFFADGEPFGDGNVDATPMFGAVAAAPGAAAPAAGMPNFLTGFAPQ